MRVSVKCQPWILTVGDEGDERATQPAWSGSSSAGLEPGASPVRASPLTGPHASPCNVQSHVPPGNPLIGRQRRRRPPPLLSGAVLRTPVAKPNSLKERTIASFRYDPLIDPSSTGDRPAMTPLEFTNSTSSVRRGRQRSRYMAGGAAVDFTTSMHSSGETSSTPPKRGRAFL